MVCNLVYLLLIHSIREDEEEDNTSDEDGSSQLNKNALNNKDNETDDDIKQKEFLMTKI